ncbi:MAG: hypothetical protein ACPGXK_16735 [Phycisphaerae bacterium]
MTSPTNMGWAATIRRGVVALVSGTAFITLVSCDPQTNGFNLLRIDDLDDVTDAVLDIAYFDDDYYDDYYDDCFFDCWF